MEWRKSESGKTAMPADAIALGDTAWYTRVVDSKEQWVGINEFHLTKDGEFCMGFVPFDVETDSLTPGSAKWTVNSFDPLDLSPSLLCRGCKNHGFIRQGKWESC